MITLSPCAEVTAFLSPETEEKDAIFSDGNIYTFHTRNIFTPEDKDINYVDKKVYIFSSPSSYEYYALHTNNFVTPIRKKNAISRFSPDSGKSEIRRDTKGICIVEYFYINVYSIPNITSILEYYQDARNLNITDSVRQELFSVINSKYSNGISPQLEIRLITFIPEKVMLENHYVFVEQCDLVIGLGKPSSDVLHPNSKLYKNNVINVNNLVHNSIVFDVVDNNNSNPYYTKLGDNVLRVYPTKDLNRNSTSTVKVFRNNDEVFHKETTLDNSKSIGLFKTKEEAIANGDIAKMNEANKLKLEKEKIEYEYKKLSVEKELLEKKYEFETLNNKQKIKLSHLDAIRKKAEYEAAVHKLAIDKEMLYTKAMLDTASGLVKYSNDISKSTLDSVSRLLMFVTNNIKFFA